MSELRNTFQNMKAQTFEARKDYEERAKELEHERSSEGIKEKLPIKNDEESSIVAEEGFEPPTFGL